LSWQTRFRTARTWRASYPPCPLAAASKALQDDQITGKDVAPFLLGYFHEPTHGVSLQTNIDLVLNNATLAAGIAVALPVGMSGSSP